MGIKTLNDSTCEEKLLWLYIIFLPVSFFSFYIANKSIVYADFLFVILFGVWIARHVRYKIKIKKNFLEIALLVMILLFSISFINSVNYLKSFTELAGLIYLIMLFIVIIDVISTQKNLRCLLYIFLAISGVISLLNLSAESAIAYSSLLFISFYLMTGMLGLIGWSIRGNRKIFSFNGITLC